MDCKRKNCNKMSNIKVLAKEITDERVALTVMYTKLNALLLQVRSKEERIEGLYATLVLLKAKEKLNARQED